MYRIIYINEEKEDELTTFIFRKFITIMYLLLQKATENEQHGSKCNSTVDNGIFGKADRNQAKNRKKTYTIFLSLYGE